jgi:hypothetical protein
MKWLESRKPFNPKAAEKIPRMISSILMASRKSLFMALAPESTREEYDSFLLGASAGKTVPRLCRLMCGRALPFRK